MNRRYEEFVRLLEDCSSIECQIKITNELIDQKSSDLLFYQAEAQKCRCPKNILNWKRNKFLANQIRDMYIEFLERMITDNL